MSQRSFNGAADLHPRKLKILLSICIQGPSFNGAADLHPRKYYDKQVHSSNWPGLQWGRGLTSAEITSPKPDRNPNTKWLQWGRGLTSAEIEDQYDTLMRYLDASMGPRTYIRGNLKSNTKP